MRRWFDRRNRSALLVGAAALVLLTATYPIYADVATRPLAVFIFPGLITAVLGGWRPTVMIGVASFAVAALYGLTGPLRPAALAARLLIIGASVVAGAIAAALREGQAERIAEHQETIVFLEAFQRVLAPTPNPAAGYLAAARYRPAESRLQTGGDFLEAIALPNGRLAVLIGDVCGHGPRESAIGAALRAGWKAIALSEKRDPVDWVQALNTSFFTDGRIDTYVTLCTGYLDRNARAARLVNAGHPPPVLLSRPSHQLDLPISPPLGFDIGHTWTAAEVHWSGDPLLLYTDGLVENPSLTGPPQRWDHAGLLAWLDQQPAVIDDPGVMLDTLIGAATAGRDLRDDVAALLITATG